ncbi:toprim domain-containing protein [Thalassotalea marina]|uniref:Toprim domain-containing protein n=1 Tax=Thalassotalea marina TaxID=1673741 RepID=A0A919ENN0_9GAMM|nr:toprim domain-containing protein [Thalassotalea marina]GHG07161.1 hypothetical protein GCM10017161_41080 [Thalassotalea marina]
MENNKVKSFTDFVRHYIGKDAHSIACYFESDIAPLASDSRVNWALTKNNICYDGKKDNSKSIVNLEKHDNRRTYVSATIKVFRDGDQTFEYPVIVFACMQNKYNKPWNKFNPLNLLFDEYKKYKSRNIVPCKKKSSLSESALRNQQNVALAKKKRYLKWVHSEQQKEPLLFDSMRHLLHPKSFSPYLQSKKVEDIAGQFNIKVGLNKNGYFTCFPLYNIYGDFGGLQRIFHLKPTEWETNKIQTVGFDHTGFFFTLGTLDDSSEMVYICEGLATGLSIFLATGRTVLVCLCADNICPVSKSVSDVFPSIKKVHVADNDNSTPHCGNTGIYKASLAVKESGGFVFVPSPSIGTDANDVHCHDGLDVLRNQIYDTGRYFNGRFSQHVSGVFNYLRAA